MEIKKTFVGPKYRETDRRQEESVSDLLIEKHWGKYFKDVCNVELCLNFFL